MKKLFTGCFMVLFLAGFVAGCGGGDSSGPSATAPTVISTVPTNGAIDVPINRKIIATFSKAMTASTITAVGTFTVTGVTGTVTYDATNHIAIFTPTAPLTVSTSYTATITTAAKDLAGNALAVNKVWTFTTGLTTDITAPTVSSTIPADAATGVAINGKISAIFSEVMDSATITGINFTLETTSDATLVAGAVTYLGTTASFTPTSNLLPNMGYTARIVSGANGVKDLAGVGLAANYVWSFTTGIAEAKGPAPVVLGTAVNYVILAKTGISTVPTSAVTGNIGVSPAAATYISGFSLATPVVIDASGNYSTSTQVTGKVYAADYNTPPNPTPSNLTTAVGDMETAYTDAAGRAPDVTELGAGDISGKTLAPGVYKWGTGVSITSAGVTLSGGANDVWIFQIAQDLTVGNGAIVTLSGGAQAKNIFWQVSGQATLGTTSNFKGIILCQTLIALNTGASVTGRLLAQTAVTLDANAVTQPAAP